jgi:hypothetical protein
LEFRIVVASPSDLYGGRKAVFEAIRELNTALEIQKVAVRGLGWEEYAVPGIDSEAQSVVSQQLLLEYDILIALFGTKLGTPTSKALSGTVEEIEHAIANVGSALGKQRVQVYFRDKIESISEIDIDDLKTLSDYRRDLGSRGIFYSLFKDDDDLGKQIRINLQRPILDFLSQRTTSQPVSFASSRSNPNPDSPTAAADAIDNPIADDLGVLDYLEKAEQTLTICNRSLNRMAALILEIGVETEKQVPEVERLSSPSISATEKKCAINAFASFLKMKADDLKQEVSIAQENFDLFANSFIMLAEIEREDGDVDKYKEGLTDFLKQAEGMLASLTSNREPVLQFKNSVENLPRITIQFNQAKRMLKEALNECLQLFDQVERSIYEITAKT